MSWFTPAEGLSQKALESLKGLADSGSSEYSGVADTLNTIAENSDEQASDEHLIGCAEQIIEAARGFIKDVTGSHPEMMLYVDADGYVCFQDGPVFWTLHSRGWEAFDNDDSNSDSPICNTGTVTFPKAEDLRQAQHELKTKSQNRPKARKEKSNGKRE